MQAGIQRHNKTLVVAFALLYGIDLVSWAPAGGTNSSYIAAIGYVTLMGWPLVAGRFSFDFPVFGRIGLLLGMWLFFGVGYSMAPAITASYAIAYNLWTVVTIITIARFSKLHWDKYLLTFFLKSVFYVTLWYVICSLLYCILSVPVLWETRLVGLFGMRDPNSLAWISAIGFLIGLYLSKNTNIGFRRYLVYSGILLGTIVLTGSRTALSSLMVVGVLYYLRKKRLYLSRRIVLIGTTFGCIMLALSIGFPGIWTSSSLGRLVQFGSYLLNQSRIEDVGDIYSQRDSLIRLAMHLWLDNATSIFMGVGFESYTKRLDILEMYTPGRVITIHSVYLQYLVGGGIIGLSLFIAYFITLRDYLCRIKFIRLRWLVGAIFWYCIVSLLFSPAMLNRTILVILPILMYIGALYSSLNCEARDRCESEGANSDNVEISRY